MNLGTAPGLSLLICAMGRESQSLHASRPSRKCAEGLASKFDDTGLSGVAFLLVDVSLREGSRPRGHRSREEPAGWGRLQAWTPGQTSLSALNLSLGLVSTN